MEKDRGIIITNVDDKKQCGIHVVSSSLFYNVYQQVNIEFNDRLSFIGKVKAKNRNDACLQFRDGIFKDEFLTAKLVV